MDEQIISRRVCVAGAAGGIGSWLVKKLLDRGHIVHGTIIDLRDTETTGLLKSLPGAETRLLLFEVDILQAHQLEQPMQGCQFVFLVAFPTQLREDSDSERDAVGKATLTTLQSILGACKRSGTVKRLIYTGSVTAASPLDEDGLLFGDLIVDESCWTRPDLPIVYPSDFAKFYASTKAASEKQLLRYGDGDGEDSPEVVVLTCGLVGGDALVDSTFGVGVMFSPLTGDTAGYEALLFMQNLLCSVPLVHLDDVCEAHLFCMDVPLTSGRRFLCASAYPSLWEIMAHYRLNYPDLLLAKEPEEHRDGVVTGGSTMLRDMGFEYKHGMEQILDDSVRFAKRLGLLKAG